LAEPRSGGGKPRPGGSRPPAVLLGGEAIAVSAARSLAPTGVQVWALGDATDPVQRSRHCHRFVEVGSKQGVQERYMAWLESEGPRGAVIVPCDDDSVELVARGRGRLEALGYLPTEANDDALLAMLDKERTYALCAEIGVPCPRTTTVTTRAEAERAAALFDYPCALKPRESHVFAAHFGILAKAVRVHSPEELVSEFDRTAELGVSMLVTEIVPGGDDQLCSYYSYLDENGQPLYHFTKRKLRQYPPEFGLGCYQMTTWDPEVAELGLRFFQGANMRGIANVEFKRDSRDGVLKLIESNVRLTAANEQVRLAGLDIPLLAYSRVTGTEPPELRSYRVGVPLWHPIEDVRSLLMYRRRGEVSVGEWLRSLRRRQRFALWRLDDPGPTIHSFSVKLRRRTGHSRKPSTASVTASVEAAADGSRTAVRS
jgi:predicted ATP-grasp superfamily ATP-dependent carboligase